MNTLNSHQIRQRKEIRKVGAEINTTEKGKTKEKNNWEEKLFCWNKRLIYIFLVRQRKTYRGSTV